MTRRVFGLLTIDEFTQMREAYLETNKVYDTDEFESRIKDLDDQIARHAEELTQESVIAINLLMQARNFLSLMLGKPQSRAPRGVVKFMNKLQRVLTPVAVFYPTQAIAATIQESLKTMEARGYEIVTSYERLVDGVIHDEYQGVIGLYLTNEGDVEAVIRAELSEMPGWEQEAAAAIELPPCRNLQIDGGESLAKLFFMIQDMQELPAKQMRDSEMMMEVFSLEKAISEGVFELRPTPCTVTVTVCDNHLREVRGLVQILEAWENIRLLRHHSANYCDPGDLALMMEKCNIVLLDENMNNLRGEDVAAALKQRTGENRQVIASISGDDKPEWAEYHFQHKARVVQSQDAAFEFVEFMKKLIAKHLLQQEMLRKHGV